MYERVAFAAYKNARITRLLAKKLLERAADVSMKSLAEEYRISWRTVRYAIENGLRKRHRRRDYSKVENISVDELHVFRNERPSRRFITTVRDQDGKAVLLIEGEAADEVDEGMTLRIKNEQAKIEDVYWVTQDAVEAVARIDLPDGNYDAEVVMEVISPISFLTN